MQRLHGLFESFEIGMQQLHATLQELGSGM